MGIPQEHGSCCDSQAILPAYRERSPTNVEYCEFITAFTSSTACQNQQDAEVFSVRCPRDTIAGVASGAKTLTKSVVAGSMVLASAPFEGARSGGVPGALCGLVHGVTTAALFSSAGVVVGTVQCVRGFVNTPTAIAESFRGRLWDNEKREWADPQNDDVSQARRQAGTTNHNGWDSSHCGYELRGDSNASSSCTVDDEPNLSCQTVQRHNRGFYQILQVSPVASFTELRRAYYRESRKCHPDKVGTSPEAVGQFQQLSEAYKVLSSPEMRRIYDSGGEEALERISATLDLGALYSLVLNNSQWEPYIGQLALSRILSNRFMECSDNNFLEQIISVWYAEDPSPGQWQTQREIQCAAVLIDKLLKEDFGNDIHVEAGNLACASFAPGVLAALARIYDTEATIFLGALSLLDLRREFAEACRRVRLWRCQAQAAIAGLRAALALHELEREQGQEELNECCNDRSTSRPTQPAATSLCIENDSVQAQIPLLVQALWHLTLLDIESTAQHVCSRILHDGNVSVAERVKRAQSLHHMAGAFRQAANARGLVVAATPADDDAYLLACVRDAVARFAGGQRV